MITTNKILHEALQRVKAGEEIQLQFGVLTYVQEEDYRKACGAIWNFCRVRFKLHTKCGCPVAPCTCPADIESLIGDAYVRMRKQLLHGEVPSMQKICKSVFIDALRRRTAGKRGGQLSTLSLDATTADNDQFKPLEGQAALLQEPTSSPFSLTDLAEMLQEFVRRNLATPVEVKIYMNRYTEDAKVEDLARLYGKSPSAISTLITSLTNLIRAELRLP